MFKPTTLFVIALLTGVTMLGSLLPCKTVKNYEEMADIRLGLPVPFLSVNMQRYTPLKFPQCFSTGSPWEDPMRILWLRFLADFVIVYGLFLVVAIAIKRRR